MSASNRLILSILVVAALAIGFWMLLLGPKRQEADKLGAEVETLQVALTEAQSKAAQAAAAKREFPADYRQLVVLGQAVPASDDTSSLLVELNRIAETSNVKFDSIALSGSGEAAAAAPAAPASPAPPAEGGSSSAVPAAATVAPTEAAASLLPLGATIGPAGLAVMPYTLTFSGDFFDIAEFIKGIDSLVDTGEGSVAVEGRLVTLDAFALSADPERSFPHLNATFSVTTYLTPPAEGVTAGATATAPPPATAAPSSTEAAGSEPTQVSDEQ